MRNNLTEEKRLLEEVVSSLRPVYYGLMGMCLGYLGSEVIERVGERDSEIVDILIVCGGYNFLDSYFRKPGNSPDLKEISIVYLGGLVGRILQKIQV